jgi:hypothetical protein
MLMSRRYRPSSTPPTLDRGLRRCRAGPGTPRPRPRRALDREGASDRELDRDHRLEELDGHVHSERNLDASWDLVLEEDRHRPFVHELDPHAGSEDTGFDGHVELSERLAEALAQRVRLLRRRGFREARAVSLRRVLQLSDMNRRMEER